MNAVYHMLIHCICAMYMCICHLSVQVNHLEPWEKGSRKTAGQTGMCGGVSVASLSICVIISVAVQ